MKLPASPPSLLIPIESVERLEELLREVEKELNTVRKLYDEALDRISLLEFELKVVSKSQT